MQYHYCVLAFTFDLKCESVIYQLITIYCTVDFNSNPFTIKINVGATDGRANVSVSCDNVTEGLESFDMRLTVTSSSSGVTLGRDTCEGQIIDSTGK